MHVRWESFRFLRVQALPCLELMVLQLDICHQGVVRCGEGALCCYAIRGATADGSVQAEVRMLRPYATASSYVICASTISCTMPSASMKTWVGKFWICQSRVISASCCASSGCSVASTIAATRVGSM